MQPSVNGSSPPLISRCLPYYDGTYDVGNGKPSRFVDVASGVSIEIMSHVGDGYRIRVRAGAVGLSAKASVSPVDRPRSRGPVKGVSDVPLRSPAHDAP